MTKFKELRERSGMNMKQFAEHFGIPYRTVQNWEAGVNICPAYTRRLLEFQIDHEEQGEWIERPVNVGTPTKDFFCSKCGWAAWGAKTLFCPGCGKRMKIERGGEDAEQ